METGSDEQTSEESEYSIFDQSEAEYSSNNESTSVSSPWKATFFVCWSSLTVLLSKCLTCCLHASVTNITLKGSQLIVYSWCVETSTRLFGDLNYRWNDIQKEISAAVRFSANTFQKISKYFKITNTQWITKTSYHRIQDTFWACVVKKYYSKMNASITYRLIEQGLCRLSGNGPCNSPGYNAKYLTYSLMN